MKYLVTGAAGFIGSQLSEALLERSAEVLGIDCFTDYYPKQTKLANLSRLMGRSNFEFAEADIASDSLSEYVSGTEVVFHLAAQPGVRGSWGESFEFYSRNNINATQRLLEACKAADLRRFVYASSSSIYGDAEEFPTKEESEPLPVSPYGATKLMGEYLCDVYRKSYELPTVILRYFTVYGPRQRPDMAFNRFVRAIDGGEVVTLYGDGSQGRDFTFVSDTVEATKLSVEAEPGSIYNVGTGTVHSVREVISELGQIIGREPKLEMKPAVLGDAKTTCADTSRITRDLGFEPKVDLSTGLRRQVEFQLSRQTTGHR